MAEAEEHDRLLAWVAEGRIDLATWISHEMHWTDYRIGLNLVAHKKANKVALTF